MKLNVKELKAFKQKSAFIKKNNVLPILDFLKFENGTVTKSALHEFIIQDIKCSETFLVDENILMNFIDRCDSDEVTVKVDGNKVILSDKKTKVISPTEDVSHFPVHEITIENPFTFDIHHLEAMQIASEFVAATEDAAGYVHVGGPNIMASDRIIAFMKSFNDDFPKIILRKSEIVAISKFDEIVFTENEKYHYFATDGLKCGFLKAADIPFFDMSKLLEYSKELPKTLFDKSDFVKFNDLCLSCSPQKFPTATMTPNKRNIDLTLQDTQYERTISTQILAENKDQFKPFMFLISYMNRLLKSIPNGPIGLYRGPVCFFLTGDGDFTALIMEYTGPVISSETTQTN